ncbi:MAG: pseudaminic acid cytidylyltransferase [Allomuricauda sp.]|jgi:N-acylneuraminate cytidylyltransferase|uniref:pseudaminic acid cytidylyltransferase n=1 Tax=Flagellimonas marinaquae TaxID=254955 RepID=UPI000F8F2549|nr:pseudaminic acid cytidylyltransferase [Allomuricauda aquimarina]
MNNLAIIPARGGSKRIPRKNLKHFLGKPIIAYSIELAIKSNLFTEVMVSTDDEEIASIAEEFGASVPFLRSAKNSDDFSTLSEVVDEVLSKYTTDFDFICCILPTAPLASLDVLNKGLNVLQKNQYDSVRPVVEYSYPIQRAIKIDADNRMHFFFPEYYKSRSQDLERSYHDAGQFYWMTNNQRLHGAKKGVVVINGNQAQDIDTNEDWELAELKYKFNQQKQNQ